MDIRSAPYTKLRSKSPEDERRLGHPAGIPAHNMKGFPSSEGHESGKAKLNRVASARNLHRQKKGRKMKWLVIYSNLEKQAFHCDKRQMLQTMALDIPIRDLRHMDPALAGHETVGQLLVRDNAIVFSIDYVRLIVTYDKVLIPVDDDKPDQTTRFVSLLETALKENAECDGESESNFDMSGPSDHHTSNAGTPQLYQPSGGVSHGMHSLQIPIGGSNGNDSGLGSATNSVKDHHEVIPFELQVLETALGEICRTLGQAVLNLEAQAHPALEDLTRNADTSTLERVRKIKTQHQKLVNNASSVRELLARLLGDDGDMWRMCLTRKMELEQRDKDALGSAHSFQEPDNDAELEEPPIMLSVSSDHHRSSLKRRASMERRHHYMHNHNHPYGHLSHSHSLQRHGNHGSFTLAKSPKNTPHFEGRLPNMGGHVHVDSVDSEVLSDYHDFYDVENLLESYFLQMDSTIQKLVSIGEYIDDTEDLVNIQLDYSRNRLIRFEICLTTGTFSLAIFAVVAGVLGENLTIPSLITANLWGFFLVNGGMVLICAVIFYAVWVYMKVKRII